MATEKSGLETQVDTGAVRRVATHIKLAVQAAGAFLHDGQAVMLARVRAGTDAATVVFNHQLDALALLAQMHFDVFGLGMAGAGGDSPHGQSAAGESVRWHPG